MRLSPQFVVLKSAQARHIATVLQTSALMFFAGRANPFTPWTNAMIIGPLPYQTCVPMAVRCGGKKFCVVCQANYCFDHWDELEAAMPLFGEQLKVLKTTSRWWTADCGESPEIFFNQMADALKEGKGAKPRDLASKWEEYQFHRTKS